MVDGLFEMFDNTHIKLQCRKLTASTYRSLYNTHIKPRWGNVLLRDVRTPDVRGWLGALRVSVPVKGHVRGLLHAIFSYACANELLDKNPVDSVRQSRRRLKIPDILTPEEVRLILAQLPEPVRTLAATVACLGLRVSEALGLQWIDINWELLTVTIRRSWSEGEANGTKTTGSSATLPLSPGLAELLLRHRRWVTLSKDEDYIFAGSRGTPPWPDSLLVHHLRPAVNRAGIHKHVGWHTFRRTFATLLHGLGEPIRVQMELLRHADSRTTLNVYAQAISDDKRAAADKMASLFLKG
jgi:integrase